MHFQIDALAYTNQLRHLYPQQKLIFALGVLLLALMAHPITQLLIVMWMSVWTVGYARIPVKMYLHLLMMAGMFLLMSLPALVFNVVPVEQLAVIQADRLGGISLGSWYGYLSWHGLMQAIAVGSRSIACVSCLLFMLCTVPFNEGLHLLRQLKVPGILIDLLALMYRFVFLFVYTAAELGLAQQARGGYRTRRRWLHSVSLLIGQLALRTLQRYQQFSLGLAARGFTGELQVWSGQKYSYSQRYALEALFGCIVLLAVERWQWIGA